MIGPAKSVEDETLPKVKVPVGFKLICAFTAVFVGALVASLIHNFAEVNTKTIYFADSRNYLLSANHFCTMFLDAVKGKTPDQLMSDATICQRIKIDGPILASMFGLVFMFAGHAPQADDWRVVVVVQSFIHALTATLVAVLAFRIVPSARYAIPAGIAYAFYLPALITAGRLMTETLNNFLIVSFLFALTLSMKRPIYGPVVGFLAAVSLVNRVLLAPPVVVCVAVAACCRKMKPLTLIFIVVAFLTTLAPWVLFSAHYLGRPMITTERASNHNAFNGWDLESDGFQNAFPGPKQAMLSRYEPIEVIWGLIMAQPLECGKLLVKKFSRLYAQPFNDFRHVCLGVNPFGIAYLQLLYVFMGLFGILLFCAGGFKKLSSESRLVAALALSYLMFMQSFFLFEANSRYGFTTIPLFVVFGALAAYLFEQKLKQGKIRQAIIATLIAVALTACVVSSEKMIGGTCPDEAMMLSGGQSVSCGIELDKKMNGLLEANKFALLLIDGDSGLDQASISVNGSDLGTTFLPLNYLDSKKYRNFNLMRECAYLLGVRLEDLRQWRAAVIPVVRLKPGVENIFTVKAAQEGVSIYKDSNPSLRRFRSLQTISVNRLLNSMSGLESRPYSPYLAGRISKRFTFSDENNTRALGGQGLRMYLAFAHGRANSINLTDPSTISGKRKDQVFAKNLTQEDFPLLTRVHASDEITVSKYIVYHSLTGTLVRTPSYVDSTHIRVTLRGEVKAAKENASAGIAITTAEDNDFPWLLAALPASIPARKEWREFVITDLVPQRIYNHPIVEVAIGLYPGPWPEVSGVGPSLSGPPVTFRKLRLELEPIGLLDFSGAEFSLY